MLFVLLRNLKLFLVTVSRIYLIIFVYAKIAITSVLGNNNNFSRAPEIVIVSHFTLMSFDCQGKSTDFTLSGFVNSKSLPQNISFSACYFASLPPNNEKKTTLLLTMRMKMKSRVTNI